MHIRIGTRASKLALIQTELVIHALQEILPDLTYEIIKIHTKGDEIQDKALSKIGDKGLFIQEIEDALLNKTIDIAIHSYKDLPSSIHDDLMICDPILREDPRDVLVLNKDCTNPKIIGTGSIRRVGMVQKILNCTCKDIRGNVDTRLRKLDEGQYDGIILAAAGLKRLHLEHRINRYFEVSEIIPACAQGAIAVECRKEDNEIISTINQLTDPVTCTCVKAERVYLETINGSCHILMGAFCQTDQDGYTFYACLGRDAEHIHTVTLKGNNANALAIEAAKILMEK